MTNKPVNNSEEIPLTQISTPLNMGFGDSHESIFIESIRFFLNSDYELALPYILSALERFKKNNDHENYLSGSNLLVRIYEQCGTFPQKIEGINFVFELFKKVNITPGLAKAYAAVGRLYFLLEDYSQALVYLNKSLELNTFLNNSPGLAESNQFLADVYLSLNDINQALSFAKSAIKYCNVGTDMCQKAACYITLGDVLFNSARIASADRQYQQAVQIADAIPNPYLKINGIYRSGMISMAQNRIEEATIYFLDGFSLGTKYKTHLMLKKFNMALAQANKINNNYKMAVDHYEAYLLLSKQDTTNGIANQLRNLETAYKIESYSLRNLQLKEEIQQRSKTQAELEVLATTDPLTGLYNRRHFFTLAEHWCDLANEMPIQISAMMIDIDHFKNVNDKYGHPAGDFVLERITKTIQNALRTDDILCRYGGEEFGLLLPNTSLHSANQVAERIRKTVSDLLINYQDDEIRVTISIGIADLENSPKHSVMGLLGHADQALYTAKHKGRNCTAIYSATQQKNPGNPYLSADYKLPGSNN
jgi:diguanylate cyclase (GGDEF)-like protein